MSGACTPGIPPRLSQTPNRHHNHHHTRPSTSSLPLPPANITITTESHTAQINTNQHTHTLQEEVGTHGKVQDYVESQIITACMYVWRERVTGRKWRVC